MQSAAPRRNGPSAAPARLRRAIPRSAAREACERAGRPGGSRPARLADLDPHCLDPLLDPDLHHPRALLPGDHADVAVALEAGFLHAAWVGHVGDQAEGFFEVAGAEAEPS